MAAEPYVSKQPGDIIRAGDWNDMQSKARDEIRAHTHTGDADGKRIPRAGIEPGAVDGSLINTAADVTVKSLTTTDLKVNGKAVLGDIADLLGTVKSLSNDKLNRAGDTVKGSLTIQADLTVGNTFTVNGAATLKGLTSTADLTVGNTLTVNGAAMLKGLTSTADLTVGNTLTVNGAATLKGLTSMADLTVGNTLTVNGATTLKGLTSTAELRASGALKTAATVEAANGLIRLGLNEGGSGSRCVSFSRDGGDEANAGKISYRGDFGSDSLNIVGAGTTGSNRLVRIYDNLTVQGIVNTVGGLRFDTDHSSHIDCDGSLYRCNGQVYLTCDDNFYVRDYTRSRNIHLDVANLKINYNSDERLKKNFRNLSDSLPKLLSLQGLNFCWKDDEHNADQVGFIAQTVQRHFPELVATDPEGMLSVHYIGFIPYIVEALKAQQQEIQSLRAALAK